MAKHNTFKYCKGWIFNIDSNDSLDAPQCEIRRSVVYSAVLHESLSTQQINLFQMVLLPPLLVDASALICALLQPISATIIKATCYLLYIFLLAPSVVCTYYLCNATALNFHCLPKVLEKLVILIPSSLQSITSHPSISGHSSRVNFRDS